MIRAETLAAACGAPVDVYLAQRARGAVIICPGGGYEWCSERESKPVALAMNKLGLHAFVLQYVNHENSVLDVKPLHMLAHLVSAVRAASDQLEIPSDQIAVCGFSAGGHLAASLGVFWNDKNHFTAGIDLLAHKPDALILAYPVITSGKYAHRGSFENLAGLDPDAQAQWSIENFVSKQTPPSFLWHTAEDPDVPCQNSLLMVNALLDAGIPCEFHLYPKGVHGLSLATPEVEELGKNRLANAHVAGWMDLLDQWLTELWSK